NPQFHRPDSKHFATTGDQVSSRSPNMHLLGVSLQINHFHAVPDRDWNHNEHIGFCNEENTRQIEGHDKVMVPEGNVLFGIENFKKCRCRVTAEIRAELVDIVKHEDGIARARSANVLNDLPRQSADIGPPMAPDLGFIAHAAEGDTNEFA